MIMGSIYIQLIDWDVYLKELKPVFGNRKNYAKYLECLDRRELIEFMHETRQIPVFN
jgi:hypothetical protein